jgi:hypothetical protein
LLLGEGNADGCRRDLLESLRSKLSQMVIGCRNLYDDSAINLHQNLGLMLARDPVLLVRMEELLVFFFEIVFEIFGEMILELFGGAISDLIVRGFSGITSALGIVPNRVTKLLGFGLLGAVAGWASLLLFPHPMFPAAKFHGISLLISPITTGLVMSGVGNYLRSRDKRVTDIETFPYAYVFALTMAIVRLAFTH